MSFQIDLAILGGGEGKRLGHLQKSQIRLGGETILERQVRCLSPLFRNVLYVTSFKEREIKLPPKVRKVFDLESGKGPLMGLYTALKTAKAEGIFLVACDMPFIKERLVSEIISLTQSGFEVVVPVSEQGPEPLLAYYSKGVLFAVEAALREGERRLISFFPQVKVGYFEKSKVKAIDPEMISFFNINTPSDLERARKLVKLYV